MVVDSLDKALGVLLLLSSSIFFFLRIDGSGSLFRGFATCIFSQCGFYIAPLRFGGIQSTSGDVGSGLSMLLKHSLVEAFSAFLRPFCPA
jgi:hypothetical protein